MNIVEKYEFKGDLPGLDFNSIDLTFDSHNIKIQDRIHSICAGSMYPFYVVKVDENMITVILETNNPSDYVPEKLLKCEYMVDLRLFIE